MTDAEKEFEKADMANAEKRAEELQVLAESYKFALRDLEFAKEHLKSIVAEAKNKGFSKEMLNAVLVSKSTCGVDKIALLNAISEQKTEIKVEICAE